MGRAFLLPFIAVFALTGWSEPLDAQQAPRFPGKTEQGFLLPNGWTLAPVGEQVILKDLPLNILPLADSRRALVATSGYNAHELTLIDLQTAKALHTETVRQSWFGLVMTPAQDKLWWSGGGGAALHAFNLKDGVAARADSGDPTAALGRGDNKKHFRSGLALDSQRNVLYSLDIDDGALIAIDLAGAVPDRSLKLGGRPYDVAIARNGSRLYVSDWAGRARAGRRPDRPARRRARSPSASIPTRSPCIPRTTGCSSPARRATASR